MIVQKNALRSAKWLVLGIAISALVFAGYRLFHDRSAVGFNASYVRLNIDQPDVVILSQNLSQLPKDILTIPVLKDLLTEDLVFYYQHSPARLSVQGTIKRIAYDHNLTIEDKVIEHLLSAPAQMYAWRGNTGRPDYWMLVTPRTSLSSMGEIMAKIALDDAQLSEAGKLKVDGKAVPLYALRYQGHVGLFASHGDRLVFLSDAGMLFNQTQEEAQFPDIRTEAQFIYPEDGEGEIKVIPVTVPRAEKVKGRLIADRALVVEKLLSADAASQQHLLAPLDLTDKAAAHTLYFSPAMLTLSYHAFVPDFQGIRFDYQQSSWSQQMAFDPVSSMGIANKVQALYQYIPENAALCSLIPVDWSVVAKETEDNPLIKQAKLSFSDFKAPVAACWFEQSPFAAPLFVTTVAASEQQPEAAAAYFSVFDQVIGAKEYTRKTRFEMQTKQISSDITQVSRIVSARYGSHSENALPKAEADQLSADAYFPVALAKAGNVLYFSPNADLVTQGIAVYQKKYPALSDRLPAGNQPLLWVNSPVLSALLQRRIRDVIDPASSMQSVVQANIQPRLDYLKTLPPWAVTVDTTKVKPANGQLNWLPVSWQAQTH